MIMPATELDDLKLVWQNLNRNLERQHALTLHQFKESKLARFRSGFRPLVIGQVIQVICGAWLAAVSARFWVNHLGMPHLMVYGILLHVYGVMLIVFAVRDLVLIHEIDYGAPVIAIQKQIARLRAWHQRAGIWFAVAGCFIWMPLMLIIFQGMGVDVWMTKRDVVYWFFFSGFVCLALTYGLVWWSRRPGQARLANYLRESSAGRSVNRAQAMLEEIERFERE
jgi:hypothetical protein